MMPTTSRALSIAVTVLLTFGAAVPPAAAQTPADQRLWTAVATQGRLRDDSSWRWAVDGFIRARDRVQKMDSAAFRVSLGRDLAGGATVAVGYAYGAGFPDVGGARVEHRFHQQYVLARRVADTRVSLRIRLEERFIDGVPGVRLRLRQQARVAWPLGATGLQVVASDEVLVNVGGGGAVRGLDGNRLFAGIRRAVTPRTAVEIGYLNLYTPGRSGPGHYSHVMSTTLVVTF